MISRLAFLRLVRDVLTNLYDPIHLQAHPLTELLPLAPADVKTAGESLREAVWQAIESLRPSSTVPIRRPEWLNYRLLWLYYVQTRSQFETCDELGLSQRSFYRRQHEALEAVASILWNQYGREEGEGKASREYTATPAELAKQEAARLALQSQRQPVDLCQVLGAAQQIVLPLARQQGIDVSIECPRSLPEVWGDPALFHQIILNVLTEGLELVADQAIHLAVWPEEGRTLWRLAGLSDQVTEEDIDLIGGLAVSRALLGAYEGALWLEKDGEHGLALCFVIPFARPRTILIIDDDESAILLYQRYLQGQHYNVCTALNAEQLDAQLLSSEPDLILLDVLMPQEDGWRLLQRLKTLPESKSIPVIICSVLSQPSLALALGAARVLQKPISESALVATIRESLAATRL